MKRFTYEPAYIEFRSTLERCTKVGLTEWKADHPDSFIERSSIWDQLAAAEVLAAYSPKILPRNRAGQYMLEG